MDTIHAIAREFSFWLCDLGYRAFAADDHGSRARVTVDGLSAGLALMPCSISVYLEAAHTGFRPIVIARWDLSDPASVGSARTLLSRLLDLELTREPNMNLSDHCLVIRSEVCHECCSEHPEWGREHERLMRRHKPDWPNLPGPHRQFVAGTYQFVAGTYGYPGDDPIWQISREYWEQYKVDCLVFEYDDATVALCRRHASEAVMQIPGANLEQGHPVASGIYLHPKKGGRYDVLEAGPRGAAIDCTNGPLEGRRVVVYRSLSDGQLYVRGEAEFGESGRFVKQE